MFNLMPTGLQTAIDNINNFFKGCASVTDFISNCFTSPDFLIDKIQIIGADVLLIVLLALIILRFLGFEGTTKYIALSLVIAVMIAIL